MCVCVCVYVCVCLRVYIFSLSPSSKNSDIIRSSFNKVAILEALIPAKDIVPVTNQIEL